MNIEIVNWDKYNPRKDIKKPSWFAFNNNFFSDPKIMCLNKESKLLFIYLLCQASTSNASKFELSLLHLRKIGAFRTSFARKTIQKLYDLGMIKVSGIDANIENNCDFSQKSVHKRNATNKQTNKQTHTHADKKASAARFDFESAYSLYPRKLGKQKAITAFNKQIRTDQDYQDFLQAIKNYADLCQNKNTKVDYIKHFSTFMNCWKDYIKLENHELETSDEKFNRELDEYFAEAKSV